MSVWDTIENAGDWVLENGGHVLDAIAGVMGLDADDRAEIKWWASGLPVIGDAMKALDSHEKMEDYLDNRGMSWSDMMYTPGSGYSPVGFSSTVNWVSDNISRLYR